MISTTKVYLCYAIFLHTNVIPMPVTKNSLLRHNVLDRCFSNRGRKFYIDDLIEACSEALREYYGSDHKGVKRRTIMDDIKFMKSEQGYSAPILSIPDYPKVYYRYEDLSYSIRKQPLNSYEKQKLTDSLQLMSRISGLEEFEWVHDILPRFQSSKAEGDTNPIISYDSNVDLKNAHLVPELFNAIRYKRVLEVEYKPFQSDSFKCIFHPHHLKQYNRRWFLFGEEPHLRETKGIHPVNFALDRIIDFNETDLKYKINKIDYSEYFSDIIGVSKSKDSKAVKIKLAASSSAANYLRTKPLHESQSRNFDYDKSKDLYNFSIKVIPNYEMYKLLMAYGPELIVLEPNSIRSIMKEQIQNSNNNYIS